MQESSLYIDHQLISPLIHQLEEIVVGCRTYLDQEYETYELRIPIYKLFLKMLGEAYELRKDTLKEEKIEECLLSGKSTPIIMKFGRMAIDNDEGGAQIDDQPSKRCFGKKKNNQGGKPVKKDANLEAEIKLIEWIAYSGRTLFGKKEIEDQLSQIKGKKSTLTKKKITYLLQKYKLYNITIRNKNGQEYKVEEPKEDNSMKIQVQSADDEVKKQEQIDEYQICSQTKQNVSPWQRLLGEQSIKEEESESKRSSPEHIKFDEMSQKGLLDVSYQLIFEQESSESKPADD